MFHMTDNNAMSHAAKYSNAAATLLCTRDAVPVAKVAVAAHVQFSGIPHVPAANDWSFFRAPRIRAPRARSR